MSINNIFQVSTENRQKIKKNKPMCPIILCEYANTYDNKTTNGNRYETRLLSFEHMGSIRFIVTDDVKTGHHKNNKIDALFTRTNTTFASYKVYTLVIYNELVNRGCTLVIMCDNIIVAW